MFWINVCHYYCTASHCLSLHQVPKHEIPTFMVHGKVKRREGVSQSSLSFSAHFDTCYILENSRTDVIFWSIHYPCMVAVADR